MIQLNEEGIAVSMILWHCHDILERKNTLKKA